MQQQDASRQCRRRTLCRETERRACGLRSVNGSYNAQLVCAARRPVCAARRRAPRTIPTASMRVHTLEELARSGQVAGRRVFIRSDLNVPFDDAGHISEDTRIRASMPAIRMALDAGAAVMVTSHLGRPTEGELKPEDSLAPVAQRLGELLGRPVPLRTGWVDGVEVAPGEVVLLENCRVQPGREEEQRRTGPQDCRTGATSTSTTRSAPRIGPRRRPTALPSSRRSRVPGRCSPPRSTRWPRRSAIRSDRWPRSWRVRRSRPSSRCSTISRRRSTG